MLSKPKLHGIIKELFRQINDINKVMIFAYREHGKWKIGFYEGNKKLLPKGTINLWVEFKGGYLNNSPNKATEDIINKLKEYE